MRDYVSTPLTQVGPTCAYNLAHDYCSFAQCLPFTFMHTNITKLTAGSTVRGRKSPKNAEDKKNKVSRTEPDMARVNDEDVERYLRNKGNQNRMDNGAGKHEFLTIYKVGEN